MIIARIALAVAITSIGAALPAQQPLAAEAEETINLSIEEAVEIGLSRSFRVQRSARNEDVAETRVDNARAGLRPRIDTNVQASQNQRYMEYHGAAHQFTQATPSFYTNAMASASMPIDIAGVTRRQIKQSQLQHNMAELELAQTSIDVATDIRAQYVNALRAQEQVRAEEEYVSALETLIIRARSQQPSVVPFLETERDNAIQQMESVKTSADLATSSLGQALRLPRETRLNLTNGLQGPQQLPALDMLLDIAGRNRNDLKQAQVRLEQARLSRVQAMDSRRPRLGVTAYANQGLTGRSPFFGDRDSGRSLNTGVALAFNLPLLQYDGGVLRNSRHIADVQAEQAHADAAEAMERAENEISQIMIGLTRANQRLGSLPDTGRARTALDQAESQMLWAASSDAPGMVAQVTNARQNWRSAVLSRNDALTDYYSNFFRLQRAVGTEEIRAF
jgi:outer membrane protein TolC